jgi:hypothetical protein
MSRQLQAKEVLLIGDSNVERNILHTGRLYGQFADSVPARNLDEFASVLGRVQPDKYKTVVFAMFTNIVVSAGSTTAQDVPSRLSAVGACLKTLIQTITCVIYTH